MGEPLVSVITVCYNSEKTIKDTLESVLSQNYRRIEYILIDGKSNDETISIIKSYENKFIEKEIIYKWISEHDNGIYDAMNKGILMATGDIIGIINSDDWYESEAVSKIVAKMEKRIDIYYGNLKIYENEELKYIQIPDEGLEKLKKGMIIPHPTVFVRKEVYKKIGLFSTEYKIVSDWDFLLRAYLFGFEFLRIDENIANFRLGGESYVFSNKYINEKNQVRKNNFLGNRLDFYYILDRLKIFFLPEKYIMSFSIFKYKIRNNFKIRGRK